MTMRRKTFDALLTSFGLVLAAVLLVSGGLLTWASSFVGDQVKTQLSEQQIFFPPKGEATASPEIGPFLNKYAGQQLLTGEQLLAGVLVEERADLRASRGLTLGREEDLLLAELGLDLVADERTRPRKQTPRNEQDGCQDEPKAGEQGIESLSSHRHLLP